MTHCKETSVNKICIIDSDDEKMITFTSKGLFATVNSFVILQNAQLLKSILLIERKILPLSALIERKIDHMWRIYNGKKTKQ